jgi:hypothetical protein
MRWLIQWGSMFGLICTLAQSNGTWQGHIDKILAELYKMQKGFLYRHQVLESQGAVPR